MVLGSRLGLLVAAFGLLVLSGFVFNIDILERPVPTFPVVHPFTAICLLLLGVAVAARRWPAFAVSVSAAVACVSGACLLDGAAGTDLMPAITPWAALLAQQSNVLHPVALGINSAAGLLAISIGQLLAWRKQWAASQVICCLGTMPFAIALLGYFYGVKAFHGALTPGTAIGGLLAALATLLTEPDHGILRALLGTGVPGKLSRQLLIGSTAAIVLVGWVLSAYTDAANGVLVASEVVLTIAYVSTVVAIATVKFDRGDRQRLDQEAELLQAVVALRIGQRDWAQESRLFHTTLQHIEQGIMMIDADRKVAFCNRHAIEMMELPPDLMATRPALDDVLAYLRRTGEFEDTEAGRQALVRAGTLLEQPEMFERRRPNGRVIEVRNVPMAGGGVVRTFSDVTAFRAAEERVRALALAAEQARAADRVSDANGGAGAPWLDRRVFVQ